MAPLKGVNVRRIGAAREMFTVAYHNLEDGRNKFAGSVRNSVKRASSSRIIEQWAEVAKAIGAYSPIMTQYSIRKSILKRIARIEGYIGPDSDGEYGWSRFLSDYGYDKVSFLKVARRRAA